MKNALLAIVLAIFSIAVLPAMGSGTAYAYSLEITGKSSISTTAGLIISSAASNTTEAVKFSACDFVEVCADHRNTTVLWLDDEGLTSFTATGLGLPIYPLPASGPTCQTFGEKKEPYERADSRGRAGNILDDRQSKMIDARDIAVDALAGSSNRVSLMCEIYN